MSDKAERRVEDTDPGHSHARHHADAEPRRDAEVHAHPHAETTGSLLMRLVEGVPDLVSKEMELLRTEMGEKAQKAFAALGMIAGGAAITIVALTVLAFAVVTAIENAGLAAGWAALIVGGTLAIIALMLVSAGMSNLKASKLAPQRAMRQMHKDADAARGISR